MTNKTVLMPIELTAENGAKAALMGEFFEWKEIHCGHGSSYEASRCSVCDGAGYYVERHMISWTTIKAIYAKAVEVCAIKEVIA